MLYLMVAVGEGSWEVVLTYGGVSPEARSVWAKEFQNVVGDYLTASALGLDVPEASGIYVWEGVICMEGDSKWVGSWRRATYRELHLFQDSLNPWAEREEIS